MVDRAAQIMEAEVVRAEKKSEGDREESKMAFLRRTLTEGAA